MLTYGVFTILTVKPEKPPLAEGINGVWLVSVVAAQSVAVLGAQLAPGFASHRAEVLLFCLAMWLGGSMLYLWIIALIFYNYFQVRLDRIESALTIGTARLIEALDAAASAAPKKPRVADGLR